MMMQKCNLTLKKNISSQNLSDYEMSKMENIEINTNTNEIVEIDKDEKKATDYKKILDNLIYFYQVFIHIFIFSLFESFFFWFYITKEEDKAILNQIDDVALIGNLFCSNINDDIDFSSIYDYQKENRDDYNEKVPLNNTIMLNSYLFSVIVLFNFIFKVCKKDIIKVNYKIIKHQSLTFILLFLYEYLFFRNIIYNYVPNSSNKIIKKIFEKCI
tara:strand:+ start:10745 stop:11389 length:645 start_codon:yes stop_codon:yes gene_type:complete